MCKGSRVGEKSEGWKIDSSSNSCPFPSFVVAAMLLLIMLAPTMRIQGAPLTMEPRRGPEFPTTQLTKIPFYIATNVPIAMLSSKKEFGFLELRDIGNTSIPSSTAASNATNISLSRKPLKHTL
ncbi:hypothetical protein AAZX31_07G207000 [Glycine max]|nr:hypothetical protein GLYMA_07G223450v4 [Glycine max]KAH1088090.1 hypothetical protein GYH30_019236 [Glycine max]